MKRLNCPGSGAIANCMNVADWCPMCGRCYAVRNDGTLRSHPMDWRRIVAHAAQVVRDIEIREGRTLPIRELAR